MAEAKEVKRADTPFRGPAARVELLDAIRASGKDIPGYHEFWVRQSGVSPESPAAHTHKSLMSVLAHLVHIDQVNVLGLDGVEMLARQTLRLHRAVRKNPKAPDFKGLDIMVASKLDMGGSALTGEFARWTAEEQKSEAFTMKQQRLFAEETTKKQTGGSADSRK